MKTCPWLFFLMFMFLPLVGSPLPDTAGTSYAAFYKYVDKNGVAHFVDDPAKIPDEYGDQADTYREKTDYMSPEQKEAFEERKRRFEEKQAERRALEEQLREEARREKQRFKNRLEEALEQLEQAGRFRDAGVAGESTNEKETAVIVRGNAVFVPAILGMGRNRIKAHLILDTGAEAVTIHESVAEPLKIRDYRLAKVRVVGGNLIDAKLVRFDYIKVGPHTRKFVDGLVIDYEGGGGGYDGLLGMNFLKNYQYSIDYKRKVIRWR